MNSYRLTHCGPCKLTDDEHRAAEHAAREYCAANGIDIDAAFAAAKNDEATEPAMDCWSAIEGAAIAAATAGWYRVPDDLSFSAG